MSEEIEETPFFEYASSLGPVIGHEAGCYCIQLASGRVKMVRANGEPSAENVEADIISPGVILATVAEIKAEASRRILAIAPTWAQSNMIARTLELTRIQLGHEGVAGRALTAPEAAELPVYQQYWDAIKAIRAYSNTLELDPPAVDILPAADWPELGD